MSKSRGKSESQQYIQDKLDPILKPLVSQLLFESPENIYAYCLEFLINLPSYKLSQSEKDELRNLRGLIDKGIIVEESEESYTSSSNDSEDDYVDEILPKMTEQTFRQRSSVSAEAFGTWNKKQNFVPRIIKKTFEQEISLKSRLSKNFMFESLDENEKNLVIKAIEERKYPENSSVIRQGDSGDELFIVESGKLECSKVVSPGQESKVLKIYKPGESFGELSLLYNTPRAASIRSITPITCWVLDRGTFTHIVKDAAIKKREKYDEVLNKVEILRNVGSFEKMQIADALKSVCFNANEYVIRQGDWGDLFYIIEEGTAIATKMIFSKEEVVMEYKGGDYFGELSLLKSQPRAANIKATSYLKCVTLDRKSFKRLLGPLDEIIKKTELYSLN